MAPVGLRAKLVQLGFHHRFDAGILGVRPIGGLEDIFDPPKSAYVLLKGHCQELSGTK